MYLDGVLVGVVDTPELAAALVASMTRDEQLRTRLEKAEAETQRARDRLQRAHSFLNELGSEK